MIKRNFSIAFRIWLRAQLFYLLLNLLTLFMPGIFLISEAYAVIFGVPACLFFGGGYHIIIRHCRSKEVLVAAILAIATLITFLATIGAAWQFSHRDFWQEWKNWMLFPVTGILCAMISTITFSREIKANFHLQKSNNHG